MNLNLKLAIFLFVVLSSCKNVEQSDDITPTSPDVPDTAGKMNDIEAYGIDTLYLNGEDFAAYFEGSSPQKLKNKNKAVFQVMWSKQSPNYFTLCAYPFDDGKYGHRSATSKMPLLFLKNRGRGSSLALSDTLILGDQQLGKKKVGGKKIDQLELIYKNLSNKPDEKVIVFAPYDTLNHLAYGVYVINKNAYFGQNGEMKFIEFKLMNRITELDPSPPAPPSKTEF